MKQFRYIVLILIVFQLSAVKAQINEKTTIGIDDYLYNGKTYSYRPPYNVLGFPFFSKNEFSKSTLWIHGDAYKNVELNYDLVNQNVVLSFTTYLGAQQKIALSLAYVDSFLFENKLFVVDWNAENAPVIYQQITLGNQSFQIYWKKRLDLKNSTSGTIAYEFSDPIRQLYFVNNGQKYLIKRSKQFKKIFPQKEAMVLIKFIKKNRWKISKMTDNEYLLLLSFINSLDDE